MAPFLWETLVESSHHILRASRAPAPASLLVTWPRPVKDLEDLLATACAQYAPQLAFGPTVIGRERARSTAYRIARLIGERVEIGVVANENLAVSYMLACRPDLVPDAAPMIDAMLAQDV